MNLFRKTDTPLSDEEITHWLRDLRANAYVKGSKFPVTAVMRAKLGEEAYYYFAGVNVENPDNRLSSHAEEGCIAAITTALGKRAEIVEGWVMGAPAELKPGDTASLADNHVNCCGKCAQQLHGLADSKVEMHGVSLNGAIKTKTLKEILDDAFSFREYAPEILAQQQGNMSAITPPTADEIMHHLIRTGHELSQEEIGTWLRGLESVDYASRLSQAVIIRLANGAYVAGTKVEEAAYVSIGPLQSAIATANAAFGEQKVLEVWSYGKGRDGAALPEDEYMPLSGGGIQVLAQFSAHNTIPIHLMNEKGKIVITKLSDSARYLPTFDSATIKIGPARFVNT